MPLNVDQARPTGPRIAPLRPGVNGVPSQVVDEDASQDNPQFLSVQSLHRQVQDYLTAKWPEIEEQKEGRRYYHAAQWTAAELEILRKRNQAAITYNRIARKINQISGVVQRQRQDPKAFPKSPTKDQGAEIATTVIRAVLDANQWRSVESACIRRAGFEAIAGIELNLAKGDHGDPDITVQRVRSETYFYDPQSLAEDFSDKNYDGIMKWKHKDDVIEMFPDHEEDIRNLTDNAAGSDLSTNPDSENRLYFVGSKKRVRLIEHWYRYKGRWCWAFYVGFTLLDEGISPFFDEKGKSISRFVMFSNAVDQDGDRYSFVRNLKGAQDEMNHRRSSGLYRSVSRQMIIEKGAVDDIEVARRERGKPDGIIEKNPNLTIENVDQGQDIAAQKSYWEDARDEIQNFANIDAAAMGAINKNLSGRAINLLQQPGMAELEPFISEVKGWRLRMYRVIFVTAQRYWTQERWLRVTESEELAQFLQINGVELDEHGLPQLVNALGQLDVNIALDEGTDAVTLMADTYDQIAQDNTIPFPVKLELMPIQSSIKKKIQQLMQPPPPPQPSPADVAAKQIALAAAAADVDVRHATATGKRAAAVKDVAAAAASAAQAGLDATQAWAEGQRDAPLQPAPSQQGGGEPAGGMPPPGMSGAAPPTPPPTAPGMPTGVGGMGAGAPPPGALVPAPSGVARPPMGPPPGAMVPAPSGVMTPPRAPGVGPHLGAPSPPGQSIIPPHLGPRVSPIDGSYYLPDPSRPGKYLKVV